ncbi:sugar phosphate isomerase/epimerase [Natroniella sulfidigena]|uniref:sugar phosphate isomerase/epimerase family protein n=1 Tax=Natroniella sulfidigena TaxID=723921 RepID=UPI00200B7F53|nr:TIM barrel protein [Natroniella sulfidigena]MCK8817350.1 sugar phosphate isomerase/epimerase [Natroniella sulfidigena]
MDKLFNLSIYGLSWFDNQWEQVVEFCQQNGFAGVELLATGVMGSQYFEAIPKELIKGLHLSYHLNWLGVGEAKNSLDLKELIENYRQELNLAAQLEVDYVVFHAANASFEEILTAEFKFSNIEILAKIAEIINQIIVGLEFDFKLLFENLWWGGLDLLNAKETVGFLEQVNSEQSGLLLDTGHLLNTTLEIRNEQEAIDYIEEVLSNYQQLDNLFYSVHLHKSLFEDCRLENRNKLYQQFKETIDLEEQEKLVGQFILQVDQHLPFSEVSPQRVLEMLNPKYITYEFVCSEKEEFINYLRIQDQLL